MRKFSLLFVFVLFSLPALACQLFQSADLEGTETAIAANIFATQTAGAPTLTFTFLPSDTPTETLTPTIPPTDTPIPSPTETYTPEATVPTEPTFGPITFYTQDTDEDGNLNTPTNEFPKGTTKVYACFDYWAMNPSLRYSLYWRVNGKSFTEASRNWDGKEQGRTCWYVYRERSGSVLGLPPGNWDMKLFLGSELVQEGEFRIGD